MSLLVRAAPAVARDVAVRVLREDLRARDVSVAPDGRISGRTAASWRSWGEDVTVWIDHAEEGGAVRVRVESQSAVRVVQVDWGRNGSNERRFHQGFRERMEAIAPGFSELVSAAEHVQPVTLA